jgi:protoporphyrinogen oxidase
MRVAIIGGGLAGLTAGAYLAQHEGVTGVLFERSPQLGGRAFTYEKSGFTLNYGAHAVYGWDRHVLSLMNDELGLDLAYRSVDKRKVIYAKNGRLSAAPLDFVNLMKTDVLLGMQKVRFVGDILAVMAQVHQMKAYETLGDYLAQCDAGDDVKELWEHLVCSNFFVAPSDARRISGSVIEQYYCNLFRSQEPVGYLLGSWAVLVKKLLEKIIESKRWHVHVHEGVDRVTYGQRAYTLHTKKGAYTFDRVVLAMPVQHVIKLFAGSPWEPFFADYEDGTPTEVAVYDIGLRTVVARPFSYISDMDKKMFISDVSATDDTVAPEGGQLLQAIAYLDEVHKNDDERKEYLDHQLAQIESLFDAHYPGWREATVVKRMSKKAMVSSIKNVVHNALLPTRLDHLPFFFCGDGCVGKGELAERAFSSGRDAAQHLLRGS